MFGNQGANATASGAGGFSFGASTAPANPPAGTGGFSFGATGTASKPAGTAGGMAGFGLGGGTGATSGTTQASGTTGFNFGASKPAAATGGLGVFNFGGAPQQAAAVGQPLTQPAATTAPSLGAGRFSFGTPAAGTPQAQQPATGFSLGGQANNNTSNAAQTATSGGLGAGLGGGGEIFGAKPTTTSTAAPAGGLTGFGMPSSSAATPANSSLLGLLGGSSTAASTTPVQTTVASSTAPASGFSFGASSAATSVAAPVASAASTGFSFGTTPSQTAASSAAPTLGAGLTLPSFGTATSSAATSAPSLTAGTVATSGASVPTLGGAGGAQKQMTFRQLEETINKWTTELEEQEKYFLDQATQVNAWDRIVMENGEKIIQLNKDVEKVKLDQQKLDRELDFVHSQQKELEDLLSPLEKALDSMPPISYQQHADVERENTYMLAENLDTQLKRMGQDLKEIIERLNATNTKPDPNDPMQQITKILNAHVVSLMWVDRNSSNLNRRIEEISKQMDLEKREQERNFRLAYS